MERIEKLLNGAEKVEFTLTNVDSHQYEIVKSVYKSNVSYYLLDYMVLSSGRKLDFGSYSIEKVTNKYISVFTFLAKTKMTAKIAISDINVINL